jgi:hypothetical protein
VLICALAPGQDALATGPAGVTGAARLGGIDGLDEEEVRDAVHEAATISSATSARARLIAMV